MKIFKHKQIGFCKNNHDLKRIIIDRNGGFIRHKPSCILRFRMEEIFLDDTCVAKHKGSPILKPGLQEWVYCKRCGYYEIS